MRSFLISFCIFGLSMFLLCPYVLPVQWSEDTTKVVLLCIMFFAMVLKIDQIFVLRQNALKQQPLEEKPSLKQESLATTHDDLFIFLSLLQEKGRFMDFVMDDISHYSNDQIAGATRIVHAGCQKALKEIAQISPIRTESEGSKITVLNQEPVNTFRLLGHVKGEAPFNGTLVHKGWKMEQLTLPKRPKPSSHSSFDQHVISPFEVDLG